MQIKRMIFSCVFVLGMLYANVLCYAGTIYVNNKATDVESKVIDSRTLVPIRGIFEELNFEVLWINQTRTAELYNKYSKEKITIQADSKSFYVNNNKITPDVSQTIIDGSLYIPLRSISEAVDADVDWDSNTRDIYISREQKIVFADSGIEALAKQEINELNEKLNNEDAISINNLSAVSELDVDKIESVKIKSLEDLEFLNSVFKLNLKNQDIDDLSPIVKNLNNKEKNAYYGSTPYHYSEINISGIKNELVEALAGVDAINLTIDSSQIKYLKNMNIHKLVIEENGMGLNVDLKDIIDKFPSLNSIDISDVELTNINDLKLLEGFEDISLPYDMEYYQNEDFDSFINNYIVYSSEIEKALNYIKKAGNSEYDRIKLAHDYIVNNTVYDIDAYNADNIPDEDYSPYGIIVNKKGVCQGYAETFKLFMDELGIECLIISGDANGLSGWGGHAWNIVKIKDKYYHIDVTFDDPVTYGEDILRYDFFLLSDSKMAENHKWERKDYPECPKNY